MEQTLLKDARHKRRIGISVSSCLKVINVIASGTFFVYYWVSLGPNWKAVEFVQILYLSVLLVLVTVPITHLFMRRLLVLCIFTIIITWTYLLGVLWSQELNLPVLFRIFAFAFGILWSSGIVLACYCSERRNMNGEVDLILYLLVLNVVTAWSPADTFNNELHLLLDVRTFMLVYNCLHQLQKNEELLHYPSFLSVVIITIATFLLTQGLFGHYMGNATEGVSILVFLLFGTIGVILLREVWCSGKLGVGGDTAMNTKESIAHSGNGNGNVGQPSMITMPDAVEATNAEDNL